MVEVVVNTTKHCYTTRRGDPEDGWDRDDTATEHYVNGIGLTEHYVNGTYYIVDVDFEVEVGKPYHLLYAVYSSGDSFGHDAGECFEVIGIYSDIQVALNNEEILKRPSRGSNDFIVFNENYELKDDRVVELVTQNGTRYDYYRPWLGAFESLDYLKIETHILQQRA